MKLFKEIYITLIDWVKDLRSTRNQLVFLATFLFMWSVLHGVETSVLLTVAGLLTICWTFYFASKRDEHKHNHEKWIAENTKIQVPFHNPEEE